MLQIGVKRREPIFSSSDNSYKSLEMNLLNLQSSLWKLSVK